MKQFLLVVTLFYLNTLVPQCQGALPPAYLTIPNWKHCAGEKEMGTWTAHCIPAEKPPACPEASWTELKEKTKWENC